MPLIIALAIIIIIAVSCTLFVKDKKVPKISNPDDFFLKAGDITVSNGKIYEDLKSQMGVSNLVTLLDKHLLGNLKNDDNKNYVEAVTKDEIDEAIEENIFPDGRTDDDEKDQETIENWKKSMFLYGYINDEMINDYFRLNVARDNYVRDLLYKEYEESIANDDEDDDLISEDDIEKYYEDNYEKSFWSVVVRYPTLKAAEEALAQVGVIVDKGVNEAGDEVDAWFSGDTEEQLTEEEIKQAFIDLYNNANAYKAIDYPNNDNPSENLIVREGVHYDIVDGKIIFNTTLAEDPANAAQKNENLFYFLPADLTKLDKNLSDYVDDLDAYNAEESRLFRSFSVKPKTWSSSDNYYYVLKIDFQDPLELDDVEDEIIDKLLEGMLAEETTVTSKLSELRADNNLVIFDPILEAAYVNSYDKSYNLTKKESENIVASIDGREVTADQLFDTIKKQYGVLSSLDFYNFEYLLYSDYNKIYEYKGKNQEGKILDKDEWRDILDQIDLTKKNFSSDAFAQEGFSRSYGWKNFLKDYYIRKYGFMVEDENDLKIFFLYQKVMEEFTKQISETTEEKWEEIYVPGMQEAYDDYFSVNGIHVLIHLEDEEGNSLDPEEWEDFEIEAAQELYVKILDEIRQKRPSAIRDYLEKELINNYNNAPRFVAGLRQEEGAQIVPTWPNSKWNELFPQDYSLSKYKSMGLKVTFQDLKTITPGQMVEPFENAVRTIWDEVEANDEFGEDVITYDQSYEEYLVTEFGYHVYVNTNTRKRPTVTEDGDEHTLYIPSFELVKEYEENEENDLDSDLTRLQEKSIEQYYGPIHTELTGTNYSQLRLMLLAKENIDNIIYQDNDINESGQLERIIDYYIEASYKSLKYVKNPNE